MINTETKLLCDCLEPLDTPEEIETGECKLCKFGGIINTLSQNINKRYPIITKGKGFEFYKSKAFVNTPKSLYRFLYLWEPEKIDFSDMYKCRLALIDLNGVAITSLELYKYELAAYFYVPKKDIVPKPAHIIEIHCGVPESEENEIVLESKAPKEIKLFCDILDMEQDVYPGNNFRV